MNKIIFLVLLISLMVPCQDAGAMSRTIKSSGADFMVI